MSGLQIQIGANVNNAVAGIDKVSKSLGKLPNASNQAAQSLNNLSRVAQDAPYGFIGIANNINPLLESFQRLKATTGTTGGALKALGRELGGAGGLGLAIGVASSLLVVFGDKLFGAGEAAKDAKSATDQLKESIKGIFAETAKEATEVGSLITILKSETETRERKLSSIKELQKIQPEIFANLKLEGSAVVGLDNAYSNYLANLKNVIAAKIIQAKIEQKITELLTKQGATLTESEKFKERLKNISLDAAVKEGKGGGGIKGLISKAITEDRVESKRQLDLLESDIKGLFSDLDKFSNQIKLPDLKTLKLTPKKIDFDFSASKDSIKKLEVRTAADIILDIQNVFLGGTNVKKTFTERVYDVINKDIGKLVVKPNIQLSPEALANIANIKIVREQAESLTAAFNEAFASSFKAGVEQIGVGLGNLLSGKDFGGGIVSVLGNLLTSIGEALIQYGLIKEGLDKILGAGGILIPGAIAIGLGIAAVAIGQAFKNKSAPGRAAGGPVGANMPYEVGERGREIFVPSTSGRIIPNNQLSGLTGQAAQMIQVMVTGRIQGNDLVLVQARQNRYNNRNT